MVNEIRVLPVLENTTSGERHATRVLKRYVGYYHGRPHRGIHMQSPDGARHLPPTRPRKGAQIVTTPVLVGLHNRYGFPTNRAPP